MSFDYDLLKHANRAWYIDDDGREHRIESSTTHYHIAKGKHTVKVDGMESVYPEWDMPVHVYIAPAGARSFDDHRDPTDVIIYCIEGTKTLEVDGERVVIPKGEQYLIPANTWHRATNEFDSIMLSIGYEDYE